MEDKPWYLSKTLWTNTIMAVLALAYPPAKEYLTANPAIFVTVFSVVNIVLRLVTKQGLSFY